MSVVGDSPVESHVEDETVKDEPDETAVGGGDVPGDAGATEAPTNRSDRAEVIIGEIPDVHDLAHMLWTARCTEHGPLGHFESRDEAEQAKTAHLESEHR